MPGIFVDDQVLAILNSYSRHSEPEAKNLYFFMHLWRAILVNADSSLRSECGWKLFNSSLDIL